MAILLDPMEIKSATSGVWIDVQVPRPLSQLRKQLTVTLLIVLQNLAYVV